MSAFFARNLKVFFRDRTSLFFSLLAVFIVIGLYVLFLGNMWKDGGEGVQELGLLVDSWMMGGMMAIIPLSTTLGAFSVMVYDQDRKIYKDFYASPLSRGRITAGYILNAFVVSIIMSLLAFALTQIFIAASGGIVLAPAAWTKVLGVILLGSLNGTAMMGLIVSFIRSQSAFAVVSTIVGTLAGFITGVYIPIGSLPEAVQFAAKLFPGTHTSLLFRQIFTKEQLAVSFAELPEFAAEEFQEKMGITARIADMDISPILCVVYLLVTTAVFFLFATLNLSRKR
jgi:multidrug/hemolysin transport system permease protein